MLMADSEGNIFEHPDLLMLCRQGHNFSIPRPDEIIPLPKESELFLLPGRHAIGLNPETGEAETMEESAVAAFVPLTHTLSGHPAYISSKTAPALPLFAYGAVGFANNRFYVSAKRLDNDKQQISSDIPQSVITREAKTLLTRFPQNRLMQYIINKCALTYGCPLAQNLCIGRHEVPLPVSINCNARCFGCISWQEPNSPIKATPRSRITFTPTVEEILEIMQIHNKRESRTPIYSFGQDCEGEPLTETGLLEKTISQFRAKGGWGTININTNASRPDAIKKLAEAGLSSIRVSLNSCREEVYTRYYRPQDYNFGDVVKSIEQAKAAGVFISLNFLYFPGISDSEKEVEALIDLINHFGIELVQLRNLHIDPELYLKLLAGLNFGPIMGLNNFRKRILKACPQARFGYYNPYHTQ